MELHHPARIYHSAEQPPPIVPHGFEERYEQMAETMMYEPRPRYNLRDSQHTDIGHDKYGTLIDHHMPPPIHDLHQLHAI